MAGLKWADFSQQEPELAKFGEARIDGKVSYMSTIRQDGSPATHPVTLLIGGGACFLFAQPDTAKVKDFKANKQFSLHCAMSDSSGSSGEFQMAGIVEYNEDEEVRLLAESICHYRPSASYLLYELLVSDVMSNCYKGGRANRKRWRINKS